MSETNPQALRQVARQHVDVSDDTRKATLRQRALSLALHSDDSGSARTIRIVQFALGEEKYAFETTLVNEVFALRDLAPIPGTPKFVLGIASVRGRIVSVIDLQVLFGATARALPTSHPIIVLRSVAMEFAVAAESVSEVREIPVDTVQRSLSAVVGVLGEYMLGVTAEGVVVLDAAKMLSDPRLVASDRLPTAAKTRGSPT